MIKVVLVDDEKMIRDGLAYTMPWAEMGVEVAGTASNGEAALEFIREKKPHVVLTDIKMPIMDGLELLKAVKEEIPSTRVIILSGYDEFSYAQQALKYGASDYLIKPVDAVELRKVMEKLIDSFQEELLEDLPKLDLQNEIQSIVEPYINAILLGNFQAAAVQINKIFESQTFREPLGKSHKKQVVEIVDRIFRVLKEDGIEIEDKLHMDFLNSCRSLVSITEPSEMKDWMYRFTEKITGLVEEKKDNSCHMLIRKAVEYIENHYNEDLSVRKVADEVHLNADYFSHLFKKIRKESFTDYLNRVRVEKAKKLMSEHIYKLYEISDMVGYSDYKYFSSIFKKYVGVSPIEYSKLPK